MVRCPLMGGMASHQMHTNILRGGGMLIPTSDELRFRLRSLNRGLFNAQTLRRRHFDGLIASMHQSGTHWVKYMLGLTLAKLYDLPLPSYISDDSIVGHPKQPPLYAQIPQIGITHSNPHILLRSRTLFRILYFPRYLILVRDIRAGVVAHYEKWKGAYDVDFPAYLRGDVRGRKYRCDIWEQIRFLNSWGPVVERHPERTAVLKYEDLKADTRGQLARVCDYFHIEGVSPDLLDEVVAGASKEEMAKLPQPNLDRRHRHLQGVHVPRNVRMDPRPSDEWYTEDDRRFVSEVCRQYLKYTFGYQY